MRIFYLVSMLSLFTTACADSDAASDGDGPTERKATGASPCDSPTQCKGDVCVALLDEGHPPVYCTQQCNGSACPSGFYCDQDTFKLVGLTFCRFGSLPGGETPPVPEKPPTLPCKADQECEAGLVCGRLGTERGCMLPCDVETKCDVPGAGGLVIDFFKCQPDAENRKVCQPDPACYQNPVMCTRFPM